MHRELVIFRNAYGAAEDEGKLYQANLHVCDQCGHVQKPLNPGYVYPDFCMAQVRCNGTTFPIEIQTGSYKPASKPINAE